MIPQQFIDELQSRTDIAEVISSYMPLKRAGRNFKGLCPFHGEKTPSFMVSPQKQIFHCFGCGEGGGAIQFVMLFEKMSFVEAVEVLAKRLGMQIPYQRSQGQNIKAKLYEATQEAATFFHNTLINDKSTQSIRSYLSKRDISEEVIKKFKLGFSVGKGTLMSHLRKKGFTLQMLEKASLAVSRQSGFSDLFRDRITFPIFDARSRVVGFGARLWRDIPNAPKYLNSLENPIYSKREQLYGINFAKDDILKEDSVFVVEGYLDMIIPFMHGIKNIIASSGTALTLEQIRIIRRYTSNVTIVFDSDKAGQTASLRALDLLLENELTVRVMTLPKGDDPDSLIRKEGKESFLNYANQAQDFFGYKLDVLKKTYDITSIDGKTKIVRDMFDTFNKLKSEVQKYEYTKKLSTAVNVKEEILLAELDKVKSQGTARVSIPDVKLTSKEPIPITEKAVLKFMATNDKAFSFIKKNVAIEDFTSMPAQKVAMYLFEKMPKDIKSGTQLLNIIEDSNVSRFISALIIDDDIPLEKEFLKSALAKMKQQRNKKTKSRLKEEIKIAEEKGDDEKVKQLIDKYGKIKSEV